MKNKILLFLSFMLIFGFSIRAQVFITEIADPDNESGASFVELYNAGSSAVDFSTGWQINRYTNGNTAPQTAEALTGTIAAGGFYIICANQTTFTSTYGFAADQDIGTGGPADSNGDDQIFLLSPGDVIVDFFGVAGEDGSNTCHEFEDGRAERIASVTTGNSTWDEAEWNVWSDGSTASGCTNHISNSPQTAPADFDPGAWIGVVNTNDQTSTVAAGTMPVAATISSLFTDSIPVIQFTITDAGGDGLPTNVTSMTFVAGANNTLDFQESLGGGTIYNTTDAITNLLAGSPSFVNNDSIVIPVAITIAEGTSETFEVAVYIDNFNVVDHGILQFKINGASHGFTADATGSGFEDPFAGGDIVGNDFTIDVVATQLSFTQQPTDVIVNAPINPAVVVGATDVNGNVDIDYANTDITLTYLAGGTMSGTNPVQTTAGIATFSDLAIDTQQANAAMSASNGGGFTDITSNMFNVTLPPMTTLPYIQNFDADLGDTHTYSVLGNTKEWYFDASKASMNGYDSGETEEDWLILPGINLDSYSNEIMTFMSEYQYGTDDANNYLRLLYSSDYPGFGDPSGATWAELTYTPPTSNNTPTPSGDIDLSAITGTNVYIAFKYHYESGSYRKWTIDNISITAPTPTVGGVDCANAVLITAGTHHAEHTTDADYDQWYKFVAPYSGTATVENCASDVDADVVIEKGTCGVGYDMQEDECGTSGMSVNLTFNIVSGETYYIGFYNWDYSATAGYDWTLSFSDVTPVNSIALLRAGTIGSKYQLTNEAVITYQQSYRNQKFIQDATGAILIDDDYGLITTVFDQYDGITGLVGTLGQYNDMLQFVPVSDPGVASSTANTITPQTITLAQFTANFEDYEAELVTISDITFADAGATFATGTLYSVTDASKGTANFRTNFYSADYIGETVPGTATVTGLCIDKGASGDGATFTARNLADFVLAPLSSDASLSSLTTDNGILDPVFATGTYAYTVALSSGTTATPTVTGVATDANATVNVVPATDITSSTDADRTTTVTVTAEDGTTTQDYTVVFNVAVSINDINVNSISVYPNPSNGVFTISVNDNFNVEVLDIAGKVLQTKFVNSNTTINISEAGVYFLRFSNEHGTIVKRVTVQ